MGQRFFEGDQRSVFAKIAAKIFSEEEEYEFVSDLLHPATIAAIEKFVKDGRMGSGRDPASF